MAGCLGIGGKLSSSRSVYSNTLGARGYPVFRNYVPAALLDPHDRGELIVSATFSVRALRQVGWRRSIRDGREAICSIACSSGWMSIRRPSPSRSRRTSERGGEARHWRTVPHRVGHVRKLVEKAGANGSRLHFFDEAGPWSCGLHRQLFEMGRDTPRSRSLSKLLRCRDRCPSAGREADRADRRLLPIWFLAPVVAAVQAMRGVALIVAVTVVPRPATSNASITIGS